MYADAGGKPQTWDVSQKGTIITDSNNDIKNIFRVLEWSISQPELYKLCLAEYVLVSISLVLIIARFFPAYHSWIVSKAKTPEHKSLYWGAAMVSNCFTLGFILPFGRLISTIYWLLTIFDIISSDYSNIIIYHVLFLVFEINVYIVLFVAAVITTCM